MPCSGAHGKGLDTPWATLPHEADPTSSHGLFYIESIHMLSFTLWVPLFSTNHFFFFPILNQFHSIQVKRVYTIGLLFLFLLNIPV